MPAVAYYVGQLRELVHPATAMSLLSRMNARFGRYAIPNLTLLLIVGQVFLYVAQQLTAPQGVGDVLEKIRMYPSDVLDGEVWRLVTFVFTPPETNPIFAFFFWYLFYLMGTTLETVWGAFRYNVFLLVGYLASVAAAFALYVAQPGFNAPASIVFLEGTVFLAFARLYPDFTMLIFFILPVKIRWLALLTWILYGFHFLVGDWMSRVMIAASVLNYFLFFGSEIWGDTKQGHRRMRHQARTVNAPQRLVHKCAVCGLTSEVAPQTQFRYCSRCDGERCYCPEHLRDHEHVVRHAEPAVERHA
jgi:hypothetical protein